MKNAPSCKSLLVAGLDPPSLRDCVRQDFKCLFENANHGGLAEPSELCFATTMLAVQCYTALVADRSRRTKLFSLQNQKSTFISALVKCAESSYSFLLKQKCSADHYNFEAIIGVAFNCFAKNNLQRINNKSYLPQSSSKKLRKLQFKT